MFDLLRYGYRVARGSTIALVTFSVLMSASAVLLAWLVGLVIASGQSAAAGGELGGFGFLVAAVVLVLLARSILPICRETTAIRLELRLDQDIAVRTLAPLLAPRGIEHLEDSEVQNVYSRAREVDLVGPSRGPGLVASLGGSRLVVIGSAFLIGAHFAWWLPPVLLGSVFIVEWWLTRAARDETAAWAGQNEGQRRARYLYELAMAEGIQELRIFGLARWIADRHSSERDTALAPIQRRRWRSAWARLGVLGLHVVINIGAVALVVRALWDGSVTLGAASTLLSAILLIATGADPGALVQTRRADAAYRALVSLPEMINQHSPEPTGLAADLSRAPVSCIRFENVTFRYPGRDQDTLSGVNLEIKANEAHALVGVNGAGKTTLVKLIAGCYRPTSGKITVDGIDLSKINSESLARWQQRIAAIVQDFARLPLSIAENIAVGTAPPARQSAATANAGRMAGLDSSVETLPNRWDTILDQNAPGGAELSGGQWQRLALARALYAVESGAGLLLLDEPAAALDVRSEAALVENYLQLSRGVTSLIISHRFSVVRGTHRISVLDEGRIVESGSHDDLMARDGRYAAMFRIQADRYAAEEADTDA